MSAHPCCVLAAAHGMSCPGKLPELVVAEKRIEELEAALVGFASAIDGQVALDDSHTCEDGDECSQHCLACHETIRLHHAEADAEQRILALGREIAGRKL